MAKKRKAGEKSGDSAVPVELDPRDSRKRITTFADVADSDDEFHLNQDEVRLGEEPDVKRRRKLAEQEEFLEQSDEEILGYSEEDSDGDEHQDAVAPLHKGRQSKHGATSLNSDEENNGGGDDAEEDEYGWGTSRGDIYGADVIETEEQALEEEAEALRLQKKQLAAMRAADYGFDEDDWAQEQTLQKTGSIKATVTEILPQLHVSSDLGPAERLKMLKTRYPEFELLSKELLSLREQRARLRDSKHISLTGTIKLRALSAYLASLVMYFALLASPAATSQVDAAPFPASQLRNHPLMDDLLKCRALWQEVSLLRDTEPEKAVEAAAVGVPAKRSRTDDRLSESAGASEDKAARRTKRSRAELHAEAVQAAETERLSKRMRQAQLELADLDDLIATSKKSSRAKPKVAETADDDSDIGDEAPMSAREAAEKAQRKKSLRFYASQIAQKANKRGAAGRNVGGDDDVPHRERLRDRQARLNAEAEKRGRRTADIGDDLGGDSDDEDHRQAQQIRTEGDDEYYDLVAARTNKKKSEKAALADAQRQAALQGGQVVQQEIVGEDGKRKISYAIEKNKGLTPHRKKDVRNPRVKKRKKYEEKKKKLASIKPIYKGGEGRGGYGGELTGIKKGLVKSTKL
jgi:U3 small nucleolar RNA-associated protein 3